MGLESWISSPCLCDRRPSLISAHGLKTSEAVQGVAAAGFFSKNHDSISQILNPAAKKYQAFKTKTPFLCHCEGAKRPKLSIKKWILVWIATPCRARLAMTEKATILNQPSKRQDLR
ncbi:hypothetical protein NYG90_03290 [Helicobacter sp. XJK30-2]|uniref:Uncharacterized protein n=1 Tax=Helicobacter zhangjianzhongii TaxID=2974574 RepID=A0ACC6FR12_9HELI|nr:hypothetical protein [Helicobacter sp. XJK30-2]MDL0081709.1 hypothetical protein [Helicobacter sp. XJK30-2]